MAGIGRTESDQPPRPSRPCEAAQCWGSSCRSTPSGWEERCGGHRSRASARRWRWCSRRRISLGRDRVHGVAADDRNRHSHGPRCCPADVVVMVVGEGARLSTGGIVIGIAAAFALTRLVSGLLHGVAPADPLSFFISASRYQVRPPPRSSAPWPGRAEARA